VRVLAERLAEAVGIDDFDVGHVRSLLVGRFRAASLEANRQAAKGPWLVTLTFRRAGLFKRSRLFSDRWVHEKSLSEC
jgi:hypothetical protein